VDCRPACRRDRGARITPARPRPSDLEPPRLGSPRSTGEVRTASSPTYANHGGHSRVKAATTRPRWSQFARWSPALRGSSYRRGTRPGRRSRFIPPQVSASAEKSANSIRYVHAGFAS
jgi:hypothetical protein